VPEASALKPFAPEFLAPEFLAPDFFVSESEPIAPHPLAPLPTYIYQIVGIYPSDGFYPSQVEYHYSRLPPSPPPPPPPAYQEWAAPLRDAGLIDGQTYYVEEEEWGGDYGLADKTVKKKKKKVKRGKGGKGKKKQRTRNGEEGQKEGGGEKEDSGDEKGLRDAESSGCA
jgi:hypothetical protein